MRGADTGPLKQVGDNGQGAGQAPRLPVRLSAVRYFTDFIDGQGWSRDEEGIDFADRNEACLSAAEALVEAAHDLLRVRPMRLPAGGPASLCLEAHVRDEAGSVVFRARLALDVDWQPDEG
jgi:hypothetical protein